jgi:hypothetical protein
MIRIKTFSGQPFQTIHVTEDDTTYNDLLKYIKIPPHPRFEEYNRELYYPDIDNIWVKPYIKFFHITNEINLKDIIDFDSELTIGFYFEYYRFNFNFFWDQNTYEKFGDDFNLPDTSTYEKCKTLIENCPFNIIFINNEILTSEMMTEEIYKNVVRESGSLLQFIPYEKQTEEICKLAVQKNGCALEWVKNQTEEICKLAVRQNGGALYYVKNQTEEICKLAVQQFGFALQFVKEQTDEMCKLAIQQTGFALQFVKEQTEEMCKLAVQQYGEVLEYVKEQTEEICKLAVQRDGCSIKYVKDPSIEHKLSNP